MKPSCLRLAVVIVSWNVRQLLRNCLKALREDAQRLALPVDVWVLDNASSDGSAEMTETEFPWVSLVKSERNLGFVKANNIVLSRLLESSRPDLIWLLNPDTIVQSGCMQELVALFSAAPGAAMAGPRLLNPDGSLQESAFRFPGLCQLMFELNMMPQRLYYTRLNGRYPLRFYLQLRPFRVDHPLGAAMMVRREAVEEVGLMDERFFMYCEEIDWAWRMAKCGWERWLVPGATVLHYGGASAAQARPASATHLWVSRAYLYRKHLNRLAYSLAAALVRRRLRTILPASSEWTQVYRSICNEWIP